jgi:hypothetical protein
LRPKNRLHFPIPQPAAVSRRQRQCAMLDLAAQRRGRARSRR